MAFEFKELMYEFVIPLLLYCLWITIKGLRKDIKLYKDGEVSKAAIRSGIMLIILQSLCVVWDVLCWLVLELC